VGYKDFEIHMDQGDKLFLYTDGLPEATDRDNKFFTSQRMLESLNQYKDAAPKEMLEGVHKSVLNFVGDRAQFDDLTMLAVSHGDSKVPKY
jgi:sigma-B regulation protein RsbU (phosphoserine phosphatase)